MSTVRRTADHDAVEIVGGADRNTSDAPRGCRRWSASSTRRQAIALASARGPGPRRRSEVIEGKRVRFIYLRTGGRFDRSHVCQDRADRRASRRHFGDSRGTERRALARSCADAASDLGSKRPWPVWRRSYRPCGGSRGAARQGRHRATGSRRSATCFASRRSTGGASARLPSRSGSAARRRRDRIAFATDDDIPRGSLLERPYERLARRTGEVARRFLHRGLSSAARERRP